MHKDKGIAQHKNRKYNTKTDMNIEVTNIFNKEKSYYHCKFHESNACRMMIISKQPQTVNLDQQN